jgi:hypothetical protein
MSEEPMADKPKGKCWEEMEWLGILFVFAALILLAVAFGVVEIRFSPGRPNDPLPKDVKIHRPL